MDERRHVTKQVFCEAALKGGSVGTSLCLPQLFSVRLAQFELPINILLTSASSLLPRRRWDPLRRLFVSENVSLHTH